MTFKVVLVNPNRMQPAVAPIGLDYLAAALVGEGFQVDLLDLCFAEDWREAIDECFRCDRPDAVGFSIRNTDDCYFTGQDFFLSDHREIIRHIQSRTSAPVILGGVGFSIMPQAIMLFCDLSLGIVGEGERAFPHLLRRLARNEPYEDVAGLAYRTSQGIVVNPMAPLNMDDLPSPRRRTVDNGRYLRQGGMGGIETKRGCPQSCVYCADPVAKGRASRTRSPAKVADEVKELLTQGVDWLHTCDSEFNIPPGHAAAICEELIRRGLNERVRWYAYCAPRPFSRDLARQMKRAGCVGIDFGADHGSDEMLRRLGRSHRAEDLRAVARACHQEGITFMYDLLLGGPGETQDTVRESIRLMREVNPSRVGVAVGVRIYPGTPLAQLVRQEGFSPDNPNLHGVIAGNQECLEPVFYLSSRMGPDPLSFVGDLVDGDRRFFFGGGDRAEANYDYNQNQVLVDAIRQGHRGAFWDILIRLQRRDRGRDH